MSRFLLCSNKVSINIMNKRRHLSNTSAVNVRFCCQFLRIKEWRILPRLCTAFNNQAVIHWTNNRSLFVHQQWPQFSKLKRNMFCLRGMTSTYSKVEKLYYAFCLGIQPTVTVFGKGRSCYTCLLVSVPLVFIVDISWEAPSARWGPTQSAWSACREGRPRLGIGML